MSQIFVSAIVLVLVQLNNAYGLNIGSDQLTNFASTVVELGLGLWIAYRRHQQGDITVVGTRK